MGGIAPSLINMSNGAVVRNLMGATTNDSHIQRIWGTKGSAEIVDGQLRLRLGGSGSSPKMEVIPKWDELGELAEKTGHAGGDFWVLYYFAREILEGISSPFDIYTSADCTIPGILAYRSQIEGGKPYDIPDLRKKRERDRYRNDHYDQPRYDVKRGLFSPDADFKLTNQFSRTMRDLINATNVYCAYRDWSKVAGDMKEPRQLLKLIDNLIETLPHLQQSQSVAKQMVTAYPRSDGARVLQEILERTDEDLTSRPEYALELALQREQLETDVSTTKMKEDK